MSTFDKNGLTSLYLNEVRLLNIIKKGALKQLTLLKPHLHIYQYVVNTDSYYTYLSSLTLVSRAAITGGADSHLVLKLTHDTIAKLLKTKKKAVFPIYEACLFQLCSEVALAQEERLPLDILALQNHIDTHISEKLRITDLSILFDQTPTILSKRFHQHTGRNLKSYIVSKKIEAAKLLLVSGLPITHIAADLHFSDHSHFSKTFKQFTGVSPRAYKKNIISF